MEMTPRIQSANNGGEDGSNRKAYDLTLYIAGSSPRSLKAVSNVRKLCENSLTGVCEFKVIDILQDPEAAKADQIIAVPTLIKRPHPIRLFIGDMSDTEDILRELEE
ncbi:MAG: hypothetical protein H6Q76_521 [Firmicutes bacterium]|nr:hypothetical protein [Bacillota bacterium]